jgi:nucleotide-binding universal stress UspA family protein
MVSKILVATDGSDASNHAIGQAADMAKKFDSELLVLNVVRSGVTTSYHGVSIKEELEEELKEQAKRLVGKAVNKADKMGVKAEGVIKHGLVDNEIVDFVEKDKEVKMIVMGAYGKNFIERQIIGSKTEGVLRKMMDLDVPLVVVPCPPCVE